MVFYKGAGIAVYFPSKQCEQNGSKHFDYTRDLLAQSTSYPQATRVKGKKQETHLLPAA